MRQHRAHAKKAARWSAPKKQRTHKPSAPKRRPGSANGTSDGSSNAADGNVTDKPVAHTAVESKDPRFGVFTDGAPYDGNVDAIDTLQGKLGRNIDIVNWYQNWADGSWAKEYHPDVMGAVTASGRTPLLTWEPWDPAKGADQPQFRLRRLAEGAFDDYIASWADQLKAAGGDVYLRPMHEMNGNWYPWGATIGDNTSALYIKAWRHMVKIFRDSGAENVKFVWCPVPFSVPNTKANQIEDYYPGTEYVDILALDGYNWGSKREEYGGWQSFGSIFGAAYKTLTKLGPQPVWIAEVGSAPQGGDKAAWVKDMWKTARTMPRLEALVWFDQNKEEDWTALPVASAFAAG